MNAYQVEIRVTPRAGLLDPQGKAIAGALHSLGFESVANTRVGRLIRLEVTARDAAAARASVDEMCRKLLANPVTEDYDIAVAEQPVAGSGAAR